MLVLCLDRHQSIRHPEKARMPITWILGLVWFVSIALVLPYMAYIKHFDLSVSQCYLFVTYIISVVGIERAKNLCMYGWLFLALDEKFTYQEVFLKMRKLFILVFSLET